MSRLHLAFRNFRPSITTAAVDLFNQKPWRDQEHDEESRTRLAQEFADAVTTAYGCAPVRVVVDSDFYMTGYEPEGDVFNDDRDAAQISLSSWSILTLFKCVREHILTVGGATPVGETPNDDPWKWACSLFYSVKPAMFRARVREGRVAGVTARDTYSADSWSKLDAAGFVAFDDRLVGSKEQWKAVLDGTYVDDTPADSLDDEDEIDVDENDFEAALNDGDVAVVDAAVHAATVAVFQAMSRDQIRALCVENNIPRQGRNKDQLIAALVSAGVRP